ncbi:PAS domain S-box protein [bacterium]|nr:PAS domain S-box protein [bacterium]
MRQQKTTQLTGTRSQTGPAAEGSPSTRPDSVAELDQIFSEPYRAIFEATGNATIIADADATIRLANRRFLELSGLEREDVENARSYLDFVSLSDVERMTKYHHARRESEQGVPSEYDFTFLGKGQQRLRAHLTVQMIPGTKLSVVSIADLSRVEETRQRLDQSEQRYSTVAEYAQEILLVMEPNGTITFANPAAYKATGIGELRDKWSNVYGWICPSDHESFKQTLQQRVDGDPEADVIEVAMCTESAGLKPVEVSVVAVPRHWRDPEFLVIARDITRQKEMMNRLREGYDHLEQVIESANAFIAFFDQEARFTLINQRFADALNRPQGDLIGRHPAGLLSEPMANSVDRRLKKAMRGKQVSFEEKMEFPGISKPRWYNGTYNPIFDEQGKLHGFVMIMLDITAQKEASETRLERERLEIARKLARTVAHEFRQPLTALRLISEIAMMNNRDEAFLLRNFDKIPDLVDRLDDLVSRLLLITGLQSKPYLQNTEILDLKASA